MFVFSLPYILLFGNTSRQIMHNLFKQCTKTTDPQDCLFVFFLYLYTTSIQLKEERALRSKTPQSEHWQVCVILEGGKAGLWLCFYLESLLLLMTCASPVEVNDALMLLPFPFVPG